jgi:hypothetical protein
MALEDSLSFIPEQKSSITTVGVNPYVTDAL